MIAVIGASGAVGRPAVLALRAASDEPLRLGARREAPLRELADEAGGRVETVTVDLLDDDALARFCRGADVVVHCAAPAFAFGDRIAAAALEAGADYVDVCGEEPVRAGLVARGLAADAAREGRRAVVSTGVVPGLSGLLPRLAAEGLRGPLRLRGWVGGVEACSPGVALDVPLSLAAGGPGSTAYGTPLAAWTGGRRVERALRAEEDATAPFFAGRVALQPYLSAETERIARGRGRGFADARWWNVHPGPAVRDALNRLPALLAGEDGAAAAADALIRAGDLDLLGNRPFHVLAVSVDGTDDEGAPVERAIVLHSDDSYVLAGRLAAITVREIRAGAVPPGVGFAHDVLDPQRVLDLVVASGASTVTRIDDAGDAGEMVEEDL
ncbi:saccharopine dehydrogenase NADP-binding domain-containing protein [Clavibacter michiganensis]|uniref:saccharopine dehydrogenase NADP-binding domain-containing protein n=1 Tax=Clavibacter michiganensis TaxID=28447 RepID=UPI001D0A39B2|nr:saccharopine dehydrogenase NADP-binding domain-containing protein [Clavibacter michiganensis]UDM20792.1 saccharopine dehydrogenase NADP-binding domain-containing protein [Clavibacter michiganensis subsp. michiganensis]